MDEIAYGKSDAQPQESEAVTEGTGVVKYPFGGRPSIEDSPELQSEYTDIYISYTIDGLSEAEIAIERKISCAKVKKAIQWCRNEAVVYADEENLIDYINACGFSIQAIRRHQKQIWREIDSESGTKYIRALRRIALEYSSLLLKCLMDKVEAQCMLDKVRSRERENEGRLQETTVYPTRQSMTDEDRKAIAEIVKRSERRKTLADTCFLPSYEV